LYAHIYEVISVLTLPLSIASSADSINNNACNGGGVVDGVGVLVGVTVFVGVTVLVGV
jgi:hypothetical protein